MKSTIELCSVSDISSRLSNGIECMQLGNVQGRFRMSQVSADEIDFSHIELAADCFVRGTMPQYLQMWFVSANSTVLDGKSITSTAAIIAAPNARLLARFGAGSHLLRVKLSAVALRAVAERLGCLAEFTRRWRALSESGSLLVVPVADSQYDTITHCCKLLEASQDHTPSPMFTATLVHEVAYHIIRIMQHKKASLAPSPSPRSNVFWALLERIHSLANQDVALPSLCAEFAISERTLQRIFHRYCATSPKTYLRILQLHRARAFMLTVDENHVWVKNAANQAGIAHRNIFAGAYRQVFGETPSQMTLRRKQDCSQCHLAQSYCRFFDRSLGVLPINK